MPAAQGALIELDKTIKELREIFAKEEADNNADDADDAEDADDPDDADDAKKGSLGDEDMELDHDRPATVASHLSKRMTALKINDSKQDTAVKVANIDSALLKQSPAAHEEAAPILAENERRKVELKQQ